MKSTPHIPPLEEHDDIVAVDGTVEVEVTRARGGVIHNIGVNHAACVGLTPAGVADSTAKMRLSQ